MARTSPMSVQIIRPMASDSYPNWVSKNRKELFNVYAIAAIAAVIYGLNSSFLFFDTQFGYESLAVALWIWTLLLLLRAMRGATARSRTGWSAMTVLLAGSTIATHHLTALGLIATMAIICAVTTIRAVRRRVPGAATWTCLLYTSPSPRD